MRDEELVGTPAAGLNRLIELEQIQDNRFEGDLAVGLASTGPSQSR
jgi:hypothetical protein